MWTLGKKLMHGLKEVIERMGIEAEVIGVPPLPMIKFTDKNEKVKQVFFSEVTQRGVLFHPNHNWFLSLAHTEQDVSETLEISEESLKIAKKVIRS